MSPTLRFVVLTMAGWPNRRQQDQIDYLREENRILREQLGDRPLRLIVNECVELNDHERNHQGLDNQPLAGEVPPVRADVRVRRRERIGGLLNCYREAA